MDGSHARSHCGDRRTRRGRTRREPGGRPKWPAPPARHASAPPDPEVPAKVQRRRFSAEYRLRILKQADACKKPGEVGALLRRGRLVLVAADQLASATRAGRAAGPARASSRTEAAVDRPARQTARGREPSAAPEAAAGGDDHHAPKKSCRDPGDPPEAPRQRRDRLMIAIEAVTAKGETSALCQSVGLARASLYRRRQPARPAGNRACAAAVAARLGPGRTSSHPRRAAQRAVR